MFHCETDDGVISTLAAAPPEATAQQTDRPDRIFKFSNEYSWRSEFLLAEDDEFTIRLKGSVGTEIFFDPAGHAHTVDLYCRPDGAPTFSDDGSRRIDLPGIADSHPERRTIIFRGPLNDAAVDQILKFQQLQVLVVNEFQLTAESRSHLVAALPELRIYLPSGQKLTPAEIAVR